MISLELSEIIMGEETGPVLLLMVGSGYLESGRLKMNFCTPIFKEILMRRKKRSLCSKVLGGGMSWREEGGDVELQV